MPSIEEHEKTAKELIDDIEEKIRLNIVAKRQKIIDFAVSEAASNLFAIFLHKKNLIDIGFNLNHSFFASMQRAERTFQLNFHQKHDVPPCPKGQGLAEALVLWMLGELPHHKWCGFLKAPRHNKKEILTQLVRIEELRNRLCYGREKEASEAQEAISLLFSVKKILEEETNA